MIPKCHYRESTRTRATQAGNKQKIVQPFAAKTERKPAAKNSHKQIKVYLEYDNWRTAMTLEVTASRMHPVLSFPREFVDHPHAPSSRLRALLSGINHSGSAPWIRWYSSCFLCLRSSSS